MVVVAVFGGSAFGIIMLHAKIIHLALLLGQLNADFAIGAQAMLVVQDLLLNLLVAAAGTPTKVLPAFPRIIGAVAFEALWLFLAFIYSFHERCLRNLRMRISISARSSSGSLPLDQASSCLRRASASWLSHLSSLTSSK